MPRYVGRLVWLFLLSLSCTPGWLGLRADKACFVAWIQQQIRKTFKKNLPASFKAFAASEKKVLTDPLLLRTRKQEVGEYMSSLTTALSEEQLASVPEFMQMFQISQRVDLAGGGVIAVRGRSSTIAGGGSSSPIGAALAPEPADSSFGMPVIATARALFGYAGDANRSELSFRVGEIISVLEESSEAWLLCKIRGQVGYVPATYVSVFARADATPATSAAGGAGADTSASDDNLCCICREPLGTDSANIRGYNVHVQRKACISRMGGFLKTATARSSGTATAFHSTQFAAAIASSEGEDEDDEDDDGDELCWACSKPLADQPNTIVKSHVVHKTPDCMKECVRKLKEEKARAENFVHESWSAARLASFRAMVNAQQAGVVHPVTPPRGSSMNAADPTSAGADEVGPGGRPLPRSRSATTSAGAAGGLASMPPPLPDFDNPTPPHTGVLAPPPVPVKAKPVPPRPGESAAPAAVPAASGSPLQAAGRPPAPVPVPKPRSDSAGTLGEAMGAAPSPPPRPARPTSETALQSVRPGTPTTAPTTTPTTTPATTTAPTQVPAGKKPASAPVPAPKPAPDIAARALRHSVHNPDMLAVDLAAQEAADSAPPPPSSPAPPPKNAKYATLPSKPSAAAIAAASAASSGNAGDASAVAKKAPPPARPPKPKPSVPAAEAPPVPVAQKIAPRARAATKPRAALPPSASSGGNASAGPPRPGPMNRSNSRDLAVPAAAGASPAVPQRPSRLSGEGTDSPPATPKRLSFNEAGADSSGEASTPPLEVSAGAGTSSISYLASVIGAGDDPFESIHEEDHEGLVVHTDLAMAVTGMRYPVRVANVTERPVTAPMYSFNNSNAGARAETEPLYVQDGRILGGTVEALFGEAVSASASAEYVTSFLIGHRGFMTSMQLVEAIATECEPRATNCPAWRAVNATLAANAVSLLTNWISSIPLDFACNPALNDVLVSLYVRFIKDSVSLPSHLLAGLNKAFVALQASRASLSDALRLRTQPMKSAASNVDFSSIKPAMLAAQLTLLETRAYTSIGPAECIELEWTREDSQGAPGIATMIGLFNRLSRFAVSEIVKPAKIARRAAVISYFIDVAEQLFVLKNLNGMLAIISALSSAEIFRLRKTWKRVPEDRLGALEALRCVVSRDRNYSYMREMLVRTEPPVLPYLGMFLTDFVFAYQGNKNYLVEDSTEVVSFAKWAVLARIYEQMRRYPGAQLDLADNPAVLRLLEHELESMSEDETYALSLIREPRS